MFNNKLIAQLKEQILQLQQSNSQLKLELDAQILNNSLLKKEYADYYKIKYELDSINNVSTKLQSINDEIKSKQLELSNLQYELNTVQSSNYIQTLGFYELKNDSKYYQDELNANRLQQKKMLLDKSYFIISEKWYVNNSIKDGNSLVNFLTKIVITSFNLTSDSILESVNIINSKSIQDRLTKIYNNYNSELNKHKIELSSKYLQLKLDEVQIRLNMYIVKQNEKEEENRRKEILR